MQGAAADAQHCLLALSLPVDWILLMRLNYATQSFVRRNYSSMINAVVDDEDRKRFFE